MNGLVKKCCIYFFYLYLSVFFGLYINVVCSVVFITSHGWNWWFVPLPKRVDHESPGVSVTLSAHFFDVLITRVFMIMYKAWQDFIKAKKIVSKNQKWIIGTVKNTNTKNESKQRRSEMATNLIFTLMTVAKTLITDNSAKLQSRWCCDHET